MGDERFKFLSKRLRDLQEGKFTDCSFLVGIEDDDTKEVHAIKSLMMMTSEFMRGLFESPTCPSSPIRIKDVDHKTFQLLVEFIHLTELITPIDCVEAVDLAIAADRLLVDPLKHYCQNLIEDKVDADNVWAVLEGITMYNLADVAESCNQVLSKNTLDCFESEHFLSTATPASLIALLKLDELNVKSEEELINICWKWANTQVGSRDLMRSLLPHLRLLTLAPSTAAALPDFLTGEEKAAVLKYAITQISKNELPATLCPLTTPRMFPLQEVNQILIPDGLLSSHFTDTIPEVVRYSASSYGIANSVSISAKRDIYLTGFTGLALARAESGLEFNSETGSFESKKGSAEAFSCSISLKGFGQDENWDLHNIPLGSCWSVRLKSPLLLKKCAGEYSVSVYFRPTINQGETYNMINVSEDSIAGVLDANCNSKVFNSLKVLWASDYRARNSFGPNGPIFIKSFNYVIDQDSSELFKTL